tara:strand:- start:548 stop:688 length:141 start_codon:yes stop_codon:yes gene_type:complete
MPAKKQPEKPAELIPKPQVKEEKTKKVTESQVKTKVTKNGNTITTS